jgi:hypothetical protein
MPKPIPVVIRMQVIERHQAGEGLNQIAQTLGIPYESVRKVWRVYRIEGRIAPNYAACGPQGVKASERVYRGARFLKRLHPRWGAGLIRQVLVEKWPQEQIPHERTLQRWFRVANLNPPPAKPSGQARLGRGKAAHNVWEMDSREGIELASGEKVSWLLVTDEASGAVLSGGVFPHR